MYDPLYDAIPQFERDFGFSVDVVVRLPHPELNAWVKDTFASGDADIDLLSTHTKYAPSQAQWLLPLDEFIASDHLADLRSRPLELSRIDGRLLQVPRNIDVRLLPGERPADFVSELRRVMADSAVEITPLRPERQATTSPLGGALIEAIREAVQTMEPGALITTPMLTGYTDSYYYRAIGIGAYGVSPFRLSEEDARTVHGNDERVTVENLRFGMEFFYRIVERVAR